MIAMRKNARLRFLISTRKFERSLRNTMVPSFPSSIGPVHKSVYRLCVSEVMLTKIWNERTQNGWLLVRR